MKGAGSFKMGHAVFWSSHAGGNWKTKNGKVVAVIPPKGGDQDLKKYGLSTYNSRDHESYVVHVPSKTGKGKGTYYWPVVSNLKPAHPLGGEVLAEDVASYGRGKLP